MVTSKPPCSRLWFIYCICYNLGIRVQVDLLTVQRGFKTIAAPPLWNNWKVFQLAYWNFTLVHCVLIRSIPIYYFVLFWFIISIYSDLLFRSISICYFDLLFRLISINFDVFDLWFRFIISTAICSKIQYYRIYEKVCMGSDFYPSWTRPRQVTYNYDKIKYTR